MTPAAMREQWAATCGSHPSHPGRVGCVCPLETRERLIAKGVVRPGPGVTFLPWVDQPTLRLELAS